MICVIVQWLNDAVCLVVKRTCCCLVCEWCESDAAVDDHHGHGGHGHGGHSKTPKTEKLESKRSSGPVADDIGKEKDKAQAKDERETDPLLAATRASESLSKSLSQMESQTDAAAKAWRSVTPSPKRPSPSSSSLNSSANTNGGLSTSPSRTVGVGVTVVPVSSGGDVSHSYRNGVQPAHPGRSPATLSSTAGQRASLSTERLSQTPMRSPGRSPFAAAHSTVYGTLHSSDDESRESRGGDKYLSQELAAQYSSQRHGSASDGADAGEVSESDDGAGLVPRRERAKASSAVAIHARTSAAGNPDQWKKERDDLLSVSPPSH